MKGCFFTFSCDEDQKVKFPLNLLHLGAQDWWKLVTGGCSPMENPVVTWEQFTGMFNSEVSPGGSFAEAGNRFSEKDHQDIY